MLELQNVSKTFHAGTINARTALENINLHVNKGDFITIIGSNGAGKSTLFNAVGGTFITDNGNIILDGKDITVMPEHKRSKVIGRLFQDPMLGTAPGMTVEENLSLAAGHGGWLSRVSATEKKKFRDCVAELHMGLEENMQKPVGLMSGGQRQALTLMMATISLPKLLLLDEHTAALDPSTAQKVLEITEKIIKENNLTCMMITHNMEQALTLGNRTIMMNDGKIIMDISGQERANTTINDLLAKFRDISGGNLNNDRMLLI